MVLNLKYILVGYSSYHALRLIVYAQCVYASHVCAPCLCSASMLHAFVLRVPCSMLSVPRSAVLVSCSVINVSLRFCSLLYVSCSFLCFSISLPFFRIALLCSVRCFAICFFAFLRSFCALLRVMFNSIACTADLVGQERLTTKMNISISVIRSGRKMI